MRIPHPRRNRLKPIRQEQKFSVGDKLDKRSITNETPTFLEIVNASLSILIFVTASNEQYADATGGR